MKLADVIVFTVFILGLAVMMLSLAIWGINQDVQAQATPEVQLVPQLWEVDIAQVYSDEYDDFLRQKWEPFGIYHLDGRSGRRYIVAFKRPTLTEK